jgi:hypothetical protein
LVDSSGASSRSVGLYLAPTEWVRKIAEFHRVYNGEAEAVNFYNRALEDQEQAVGPDHPDIAITLENYAELLRNANRQDEAAKLEARAKTIRAKHGQ